MSKYPIKEQLNAEEKAKLMKSLEKGNLAQVTFAREGGEDKMFIAANPQYKNLDLYDSRMQKQFQGIEKKERPTEDKSQDKKESVKQDVDVDGGGNKEKKNSKRKGIGV